MYKFVHNTLTISKTLWNKIKVEESDNYTLDFNAIVPMPESIKTAARDVDELPSLIYYLSNRLEEGLTPEVLWQYYQEVFYCVNEDATLAMITFDYNRLQNGQYTSEQLDALFVKGQQYKTNYDNTGDCDWCGWSIHNWGTKGNAIAVSTATIGDAVRIVFDTVDNPPFEFYGSMLEQYPSENYSGTYEYTNGESYEWEYVPEDKVFDVTNANE